MKRLLTKFLGSCISVFGFVTFTDLGNAHAATCRLSLIGGGGDLADHVSYTATAKDPWYVAFPNDSYTASVSNMWWNDSSFYNVFGGVNYYDGGSYGLPDEFFSDSTVNSYCLKSTADKSRVNFYALGLYTVRPTCALGDGGYALYVHPDALGLITSHFGCCHSGYLGSSGYSGTGSSGTSSSSSSYDNCPCFYIEANDTGSFTYNDSKYNFVPLIPYEYTYCFSGCHTGTYQENYIYGSYSGTYNMPNITIAEQLKGATGCITLVHEPGLMANNSTVTIPGSGSGSECFVPSYFGGGSTISSYSGRCLSDGCTETGGSLWTYYPGQCRSCPGKSSVANSSVYPDGSTLVVSASPVDGTASDCYASSITGSDSAGSYTYSCKSYYTK